MKRVGIALIAVACLTGAMAGSALADQVQSGSFVADQGGTPSPSTPFETRSNILQNPGFETNALAPWISDAWTVITTDYYTGTHSAQGITNVSIRQNFTPTDVTTMT